MNLTSASSFINPNTERLFQKKCGSFQYLSINVTKRINLGFFQGMIWKAGDQKNKQHLGWQYYNPVIFSNLAFYGFDGENNIVAGSDVQVKISSRINGYLQYMFDGKNISGRNKPLSGIQAGANFYRILGLKGLSGQVEYNQVQKGAYASPDSLHIGQSYSHYNQNLGFTLTNGFETTVMLRYLHSRIFAECRVSDQHQNPGINASAVKILNARLGYVINPSYNLNVCLGFIQRTQKFYNFGALDNHTNYIYIGFRTSIYNLYYDF
jgi:hypothetical protein